MQPAALFLDDFMDQRQIHFFILKISPGRMERLFVKSVLKSIFPPYRLISNHVSRRGKPIVHDHPLRH